LKNQDRKSVCPECRTKLIEKSRQEIYFCDFCNTNSQKNPEDFEQKEKFATEKLIEADLILVAPRHLFRMPYSLHEKTALSSVVLNKHKIKDFQITDAKPFKVKVKKFYPDAQENEAKELLLQALDYQEQKKQNSNNIILPQKTPNKENKNFYQNIKIPNLSEELYPPCIRLLLKGIKDDGRKRALFILLNFFKSLKLNNEEIAEKINKWNEKNYKPLKQGYLQSQFNWYSKNPAIQQDSLRTATNKITRT